MIRKEVTFVKVFETAVSKRQSPTLVSLKFWMMVEHLSNQILKKIMKPAATCSHARQPPFGGAYGVKVFSRWSVSTTCCLSLDIAVFPTILCVGSISSSWTAWSFVLIVSIMLQGSASTEVHGPKLSEKRLSPHVRYEGQTLLRLKSRTQEHLLITLSRA